MVNFSPKANLRHIRSYSAMEEFTTGGFQEVLDDPYITNANEVKRVLLCSGKMYFDLSEKQMADQRSDVAIVRLEQIYPLPQAQLEALQTKYKGAKWYWVQEEPKNMGALPYLKLNLENIDITYLSRTASASPATGFAKMHTIEQNNIIDAAFA